MDPRFYRHFDICNSAVLPGDRVALCLADQHIGWVKPEALAACGYQPADGRFTMADSTALAALTARMHANSLYRHRDEWFDVRATYDGPVLAQVDRGLMPTFGLLSQGVHVNGLVRLPEGLHVWVGRRAPHKLIAPGKLDHLIGGGVPAGLDTAATLIKEGAEEAGLPEALAAQAVKVAEIDYAMRRPEGVSRDRIHCYDLLLPADFQPEPVDGEVDNFELWPLRQAMERVRDTDDFKYNVNLVLIDLFIRNGLLEASGWSIIRSNEIV